MLPATSVSYFQSATRRQPESSRNRIHDSADLVSRSLWHAGSETGRSPRSLKVCTLGLFSLQKDVIDMASLLPPYRFLRVPGPLWTGPQWKRFLSPTLLPTVKRMLTVIATRHTKAQVTREMELPLQVRTLVPIEFNNIESAFYSDVWHGVLAELGLDERGAPRTNEWQLDVFLMRAQLLRLRQVCTHPQVVTRSLTGLGAGSNLRSIDQVLAVMIEHNEQEVSYSHLSLVQKQIRRVLLILAQKDAENRLETCRAHLEELCKETTRHVEDARTGIKMADTRGALYQFDKSEEGGDNNEINEIVNDNKKEKENGNETDGDGETIDPINGETQRANEVQNEDEEGLTTEQSRARIQRKQTLTTRLRDVGTFVFLSPLIDLDLGWCL